MNKFLIIFLILFCSKAEADTLYIRDDGGDLTQCDGLHDAPRSADKKCAFNQFYKDVTFSATKEQNIIITKGTFTVSIQSPDIWIPVATFIANPNYYLTEAIKGRRVYFSQFNGVARQLKLEKY